MNHLLLTDGVTVILIGIPSDETARRKPKPPAKSREHDERKQFVTYVLSCNSASQRTAHNLAQPPTPRYDTATGFPWINPVHFTAMGEHHCVYLKLEVLRRRGAAPSLSDDVHKTGTPRCSRCGMVSAGGIEAVEGSSDP